MYGAYGTPYAGSPTALTDLMAGSLVEDDERWKAGSGSGDA